jgi:hypothetical protein
VEILRVDYFLQGIPVKAGGHRIELRYRLSAMPAIVSLFLLVACLCALALTRRRARSASSQGMR